MSRPKPDILLSCPCTRGKSVEQTLQVLAAPTLYFVAFCGQPINLRVEGYYEDRKYLRTSFPNRGWASRLALRLNEKFNETRFAVLTITKDTN